LLKTQALRQVFSSIFGVRTKILGQFRATSAITLPREITTDRKQFVSCILTVDRHGKEV